MSPDGCHAADPAKVTGRGFQGAFKKAAGAPRPLKAWRKDGAATLSLPPASHNQETPLKKFRLLAAMALACSFLAPAAASAAEGFFDSAGVKIRYLDEGRGEPVILVHGYSTNTEAQW